MLLSLSSIYNLRKHVTIAHSDEEWLCDSCPKKFTNPLSLKRHRSTHAEKSLPCHVCGKQFRSSSNLRQHMLSHSDRRPFVCPVCQSGFKTKDKLQRHQKGHCKGVPNVKVKQNGEAEATKMETNGEVAKTPPLISNLPAASGLLPTQPPPVLSKVSSLPNLPSALPKLPNAPLVLPKTPLPPTLPNGPSSVLSKAAPVLPNTPVVLSKPLLPNRPLALTTPQLVNPHHQMALMPPAQAMPLVVSAIPVVPMATVVQNSASVPPLQTPQK